jgi:hypothetical protein
MEIHSLTCQSELLPGQLDDIARVFVNPRQDKLANLLSSSVACRSHRLPVSALVRHTGRRRDIVKVINNIVKVNMGIVKAGLFFATLTCWQGSSFISSSLRLLIVKGCRAEVEQAPTRLNHAGSRQRYPSFRQKRQYVLIQARTLKLTRRKRDLKNRAVIRQLWHVLGRAFLQRNNSVHPSKESRHVPTAKSFHLLRLA